jgi:hypothetical protein
MPEMAEQMDAFVLFRLSLFGTGGGVWGCQCAPVCFELLAVLGACSFPPFRPALTLHIPKEVVLLSCGGARGGAVFILIFWKVGEGGGGGTREHSDTGKGRRSALQAFLN